MSRLDFPTPAPARHEQQRPIFLTWWLAADSELLAKVSKIGYDQQSCAESLPAIINDISPEDIHASAGVHGGTATLSRQPNITLRITGNKVSLVATPPSGGGSYETGAIDIDDLYEKVVGCQRPPRSDLAVEVARDRADRARG